MTGPAPRPLMPHPVLVVNLTCGRSASWDTSCSWGRGHCSFAERGSRESRWVGVVFLSWRLLLGLVHRWLGAPAPSFRDVRDQVRDPSTDPVGATLSLVTLTVVGLASIVGIVGTVFFADVEMYWAVAQVVGAMIGGLLYLLLKWVLVRLRWVANRVTLWDELFFALTAVTLWFGELLLR